MTRRRVGWRRSPPRWLACLPLLLVLDAKVLHVLPQHTCRPYDVLQNANQKDRYEKGEKGSGSKEGAEAPVWAPSH